MTSRVCNIGASGNIAVLTSFSPSLVRMNRGQRMEDYDRACLQSWLACGFRVLAFNTSDEIPPLAARYPEIEFIPAPRTARAELGRDTPFIADMLSVLAAREEPVLGIINSDLLFEPNGFWRELPAAVGEKAVLTGQRYDARSLTGMLHVYFPGFDYFFFNRSAAAALAQPQQPFSMGLPWWDYWFPLSLALRGYDVQCLTRPAVLHLQHDQQVNARTPVWRRLAREFARAMLQGSAAGKRPPPEWYGFLTVCRALDQADHAKFESGGFDQAIIDLSAQAVPLIARNKIERQIVSSPASIPGLPESTFHNLAERTAAGTALVRGLWDDRHGNVRRAEQQMEFALQSAPLDPAIYLEAGNFFYRHGNMTRAAELLFRAAEQLPGSAIVLNALGSALGALNRNEEAAACFERAIAAEPLNGFSYYNLAAVLGLKNGHAEAVYRLEQQITLTPDFPDGALWLTRIGEMLSRLEQDARPFPRADLPVHT